jgi:hypothetical protein
MRRIACAVFGFAVILGAASLGLTRHAEAAPRSVLKALDTDNAPRFFRPTEIADVFVGSPLVRFDKATDRKAHPRASLAPAKRGVVPPGPLAMGRAPRGCAQRHAHTSFARCTTHGRPLSALPITN